MHIQELIVVLASIQNLIIYQILNQLPLKNQLVTIVKLRKLNLNRLLLIQTDKIDKTRLVPFI